MVQKNTIREFLHASRQGLGLGRYRSSTSIGRALEITSNGRVRAFEKRTNMENSIEIKSSKLCLEKILLGMGVFSAGTYVTYLATGQIDLSKYIAPIVGGLITAYIVSEPTCESSAQSSDLNKSKSIPDYEKQMQILDTAKPEDIKRTLQRYEHYYY